MEQLSRNMVTYFLVINGRLLSNRAILTANTWSNYHGIWGQYILECDDFAE